MTYKKSLPCSAKLNLYHALINYDLAFTIIDFGKSSQGTKKWRLLMQLNVFGKQSTTNKTKIKDLILSFDLMFE